MSNILPKYIGSYLKFIFVDLVYTRYFYYYLEESKTLMNMAIDKLYR